MIRYDVLWHDLMKDLYERCMKYENAAEELEKMHADNMSQENRKVSWALYEVLRKANGEYKKMQEKDEEEQHNANVMLQEILQELKKLNKGKEDEADGELDGKGDDPGSESSGKQEDHL